MGSEIFSHAQRRGQTASATYLSAQNKPGIDRHRRLSLQTLGVSLPYSITTSARARIDGGTVRPSALAVLRLITSSNIVGCCTGRSAGLAPFRILPAYLPTSRMTAMLST